MTLSVDALLALLSPAELQAARQEGQRGRGLVADVDYRRAAALLAPHLPPGACASTPAPDN